MTINWQEAERLRHKPRPFAQLRLFDPRRSPNRERSLRRRRRLAMSGPMPPGLACRFTVGELAALRIIGDECRYRGRCVEFNGAIAARAGVSVSTVKRAKRIARDLGLIVVVERRAFAGGHGKPPRNDSSVVRVISPRWLDWLRHSSKNSAVQLRSATDNQRQKEALRGEIRKFRAGVPDRSG